MNIAPLNSNTTQVLDLLNTKQATPETRVEVDRPERPRRQREGGFDQALRESSSQRPSRESEPVQLDEAGRGETGKADDQPEPVSDAESKPEAASSDEGREDTKASSQDTENGSASQSTEETEAQAEAQAQQQAEASAAQAQSDVATAIQIALGPASGAVKAEQSPDELKAFAGSEAEKQALAAAAQAARDAAARNQGRGQGVPIEGTIVFSTATTQQQGAQADTGGEAKGETSTASQITTAGQAAGNNAATGAVFTVSDQQAGETRLQLNPVNATQQAESAKALQAQPLAGQSDNDSLNTARLTRGLANAVQQRGGAVTLRLTPPEMGTVRIQMQITGTNVSAAFHAESASAQTLLTQQLSQLRTALETQGMNVEKLSVQPLASTSQSQNANQSQGDNQQQNQGAQQQSANDGRSRGQHNGSPNGQGSSADRDGDTAARPDLPRGFFDQLQDSAENAAA